MHANLVAVEDNTLLEIVTVILASASAKRNMLERIATDAMLVIIISRAVFHAIATRMQPTLMPANFPGTDNVHAKLDLVVNTADNALVDITTTHNVSVAGVTALGPVIMNAIPGLASVTANLPSLALPVNSVPLATTLSPRVTCATVMLLAAHSKSATIVTVGAIANQISREQDATSASLAFTNTLSATNATVLHMDLSLRIVEGTDSVCAKATLPEQAVTDVPLDTSGSPAASDATVQPLVPSDKPVISIVASANVNLILLA